MTTNNKPDKINPDQIETQLVKLISAHRNFQNAIKIFEENTGMETAYSREPLQLYGQKAYQFLLEKGGIESVDRHYDTNEIELAIDGILVICVKN